VFLGGNSPLVCLSFVGLLVPAHLFLWKLGTWFTTGIALRRGRALGVILFILQARCSYEFADTQKKLMKLTNKA